MTRFRRSAVVVALVVAIVAFFAVRTLTSGSGAKELSLDQFTAKLDAGKVDTATIHDRDHDVTGKLADGTEYKVDFPEQYTERSRPRSSTRTSAASTPTTSSRTRS